MGRSGQSRQERGQPYYVVKSTIGLSFMLGRSRGCIGLGPGEHGGASYGRRAVATAEWAAMQISVEGKGLKTLLCK